MSKKGIWRAKSDLWGHTSHLVKREGDSCLFLISGALPPFLNEIQFSFSVVDQNNVLVAIPIYFRIFSLKHLKNSVQKVLKRFFSV